MANEYALLIIGGVALFSILVFFIIVFIVLYQKRYYKYLQEKILMQNQFQQELLKTQLETQEETFYQISEELHDNIGQLLSSSKLLLNVARRELPNVPDALHTSEEILGKAIQDLRSMSKSLNKEWLSSFNVIDNLRAEASRINTAKAIIIQLHATAGLLPLAAESQVVLFRIMQEALQNSIRHGNPKHINIHIAFPDSITILIQDDGAGFDSNLLSHDGIGLMNMKHRTKLLGGTIEWKSVPGEGTQVHISLPVQQEFL